MVENFSSTSSMMMTGMQPCRMESSARLEKPSPEQQIGCRYKDRPRAAARLCRATTWHIMAPNRLLYGRGVRPYEIINRRWHSSQCLTRHGEAEDGAGQQLRVRDLPVFAVRIDVDLVLVTPVVRLALVVDPLPDAPAVPRAPKSSQRW